MAGDVAFTGQSFLLTRDKKSTDTLLELLRWGGIANALATGPMDNSLFTSPVTLV